MTAPAPWPVTPPAWLQSWVIWRFQGKPSPRPVGIPLAIPAWAWGVLEWCAWRRANRVPPRPNVPLKIPSWAFSLLKILDQAVPVVPPPPPPPPPDPPPPNSWTLPNPLAFTAWGWLTDSNFRDTDTALQLMQSAGVRTVGLQIGQFQPTVPDRCRAFGLKIFLWGVPDPADGQALEDAQADGYVPQIEGPYQYQAALANLQAGVGAGLALSTVTTVSPFSTFITLPSGVQTTTEAEALKSLGLTHCWTETYLEETNVNPVTLNWEAGHRGFPYHNPALGTYHDQPISSYRPWVDPYGKQVGIYLAETTSPTEWAAVAELGT